MSKGPPPEGYDDNPEWTSEDFARARPANEVLPTVAISALVKNRGGRPAGQTKEQVSLRIDRDVLESYRAAGAGWQTRMNDDLRARRRSRYSVAVAARGQGVGAVYAAIAG